MKELAGILKGLAHYVDNINRAPAIIRNKAGVYRQRDKDAIQKTKWGQWEFGYQLSEHKGFLIRKAFIKCPGLWQELDKKEMIDIATTVLDAMFDKQQCMPKFIQIAPDCMLIGQKFQVTFLKERNPNLVSISNMPAVGSA